MQKILHKKIIVPFLDILKQGTNPQKLAQSVTLGFIMGIIPVLGISTWLCAIIVVKSRLNMVSVQLTNYLAYPFQILLFLPFIRLGTFIVPQPHVVEDLEILLLIREAPIQAFMTFGKAIFGGVMAWGVVVLPLSIILYWLFFAVFDKMHGVLQKKKACNP